MTAKTTHYQSFIPQSTNIGGYRYFFNGQEADNEMFGELANFGYEFRQYDSRLGRWWSVDPKWNEYPSVSPYVFCNGSPILLVDWMGKEAWIPSVDKKGNVTYTAEKGDSYDSFVAQFDCRSTDGKHHGKEIFANAGLKSDGSVIKEGTVIKGDDVKKATGSDVLKVNWHALDSKPHQKVAQLIFAINYSKKQGKEFFDFSDFAIGFETISSEQLSYINYPTPEGNIYIKNLSIWFTTSQTKSYNFYMYSQSYGDWLNKYDFRLPKEGSYRPMLMFTVDGDNSDQFEELFIK